MRNRLSGRLLSTLVLSSLAFGGLGTASIAVSSAHASPGSPTARTTPAPDYITGLPRPADGHRELPRTALPPVSTSKTALRVKDSDPTPAPTRPSVRTTTARVNAVAECNVSDFTSLTGSALVTRIKSSTTECINKLFSVKGSDGNALFRESQMTSVAYALRDNAANYPGNNSTSTAQLALYLRAGYYVQYYDPATVGSYGSGLRTAIQSALDAFFASPRSQDVNDANGEILAEAVTLIDSAEQNDRYLYVIKRLLNGYNQSYDSSFWMLTAVNNTYTVLFRGHQVPAFVQAVAADRSLLDTLYNFASTHLDLLGGEQSYLTSNAGRELARFLGDPSIKPTVKPLVKALLDRTSMTGTTAALWVGLAEMTQSYDAADCSFYGTCNLSERLGDAVLPVRFTCSPSITIRAQQMTSTELTDSCTSLKGQDALFHKVARDPGPVANDQNDKIEVVVFDSSTDYQTYAGAMFGIDTNNGGMYLEGDPSVAGNQPRFIAYEAEWTRPSFQVWNLNHEYTHYLDGRYNMYGDFGDNISTPTIWWIEGFAEYISYSYRGEAYTAAQAEAAKNTYTLRQLFDTTYDNADTTRIYRWGYLASSFMLNKHPDETQIVLGYYRTGNWAAARTYLTSTIGTRYDAEFRAFLTACAAGDCGGTPIGGNQTPTAAFTSSTNGLTATFTDGSRDTDGTIASRRWDFGDGTTSTGTNPTKTYAAAGTYTVTLTVTDNAGATATTKKTVTVTGGGSQVPECTGHDTRALSLNCQRSNRSAGQGEDDLMFIYVPENTRRLTITTSGGTGNSDLYYNHSGWAIPSYHVYRSTAAGNNATITVDYPAAGYHYISLHGSTAFSGVNISVTN